MGSGLQWLPEGILPSQHWHYNNSKLDRDLLGYEDKQDRDWLGYGDKLDRDWLGYEDKLDRDWLGYGDKLDRDRLGYGDKQDRDCAIETNLGPAWATDQETSRQHSIWRQMV